MSFTRTVLENAAKSLEWELQQETEAIETHTEAAAKAAERQRDIQSKMDEIKAELTKQPRND